MRNNETGEFELVVGNRQIISGFFIVVLLFAVGVAMGYFLGQNAPRSAKLPAETAAASAPPSAAVDARPQPAAPAQPAATPPAESAQAQQPPADSSPQPSTQPVRDPAATPPAAATSPAAAAPATVAEAAPGTYWQVMAVGKGDADVVVRTLQNKGFPGTTSPGTKGLTRVVVGPYPDRTALGRAKTELEAAGFTNLYKVDIGGEAGHK